MGRVEASPGTQRREKVKLGRNIKDASRGHSRWERKHLTRDCEFKDRTGVKEAPHTHTHTHTLVIDKCVFQYPAEVGPSQCFTSHKSSSKSRPVETGKSQSSLKS